MNMLENICGKVAPGLCRLSVNGQTAVRTADGYRCYDFRKKRLMNCDSFVLDAGDDFFFVMPTRKVKPGDIILAGGKPRCVLSSDGDTLTVISYETATVEQILPERHLFMGNVCFFGKIVSLFGRGGSGGISTGRMMKYMLLSGLTKGRDGEAMSPMMAMALMSGKDGFPDGLFDIEDDEEEEEDAD